MEHRDQLKETFSDEKKLKKRKWLSYGVFIGMIAAFLIGRNIFLSQPKVDGALAPLRSTLSMNQKIFETLFDSSKKVKEYPLSEAVKKVKVNGYDGLRSALDSSGWRLKVVRAPGDTLFVTLDEIKRRIVQE
jgi:hypothetical protein